MDAAIYVPTGYDLASTLDSGIIRALPETRDAGPLLIRIGWYARYLIWRSGLGASCEECQDLPARASPVNDRGANPFGQ
jgi:hypothetical protein